MWKFLLPNLNPSHWNTYLFLFGIYVVFSRWGLRVCVCICLIWFNLIWFDLIWIFLMCDEQRASGLHYWAWFAPAKVPAKNTRPVFCCKGKVCLFSLGLKLILSRILTQFITFHLGFSSENRLLFLCLMWQATCFLKVWK